MPVFSLPSKYGIGCFSKEAYKFVDQLKKAGQSYWQILPLGPTGYGDSPYQSFSTYAGNPYFIDLEAFVKAGCLDESDCENCDWGGSESYVDYEKIYNSRFRLLRKAFENYDCEGDPSYQKFINENVAWLEDYSLYMAIKDSLNGISWIEWPKELKNREKDALAEAREKLTKEVGFYCFQQYWFFKQWTELKTYANEKGVEIIGDVPIYVAFDSADAWAHPELFQLDQDALVPLRSRTNTFTHLAEYPMTDYDISLLLDGEVKWADVAQTIGGVKNELLHGASFVDEYRGKQVPEGKKSLTARLTIGSREKTLTSAEIEEVANTVLKKLAKRFGAELRSR